MVIDYGIGFDLNQPIPINEARNLHYSAHWPDALKILAVNTGDQGPVLNAGEQNPRAHHVVERGACAFEGSGDNLEAATRLRSCVASANGTAVRSKGCGTRDRYHRAGADRPRKADLCLIRATA